MMVPFFLLLTITAERNFYDEMKGLLQKFNCLMENDLKKTFLNSADHCEGSVYAKNVDDISKKDEKIAPKPKESNEISAYNRNNADRLQLEISTYNLKQRLEDKLKTDQEKKLHKNSKEHLIFGKPRKIKVVKIVPVLV